MEKDLNLDNLEITISLSKGNFESKILKVVVNSDAETFSGKLLGNEDVPERICQDVIDLLVVSFDAYKHEKLKKTKIQ